MIILAQFLKKNGGGGLTAQIDTPEKITTLPIEYDDAELQAFFEASLESSRHQLRCVSER